MTVAVQYVKPKNMFHPLRHEVCDSYLAKVIEACEKGEDWMSLEEIQAAADYLYDAIAIKHQTVEGSRCLQ